MSVYLDTSALAKRYLNEPGSDEFEAFLQTANQPTISSLTVVEMRCLLARHRRSGHFDAELEAHIFAQFEEDLARGHVLLRPLEDSHVLSAVSLLERFYPHSLRSLDALHLSLAVACAVEALATADRVMAAAARELGLEVIEFG